MSGRRGSPGKRNGRLRASRHKARLAEPLYSADEQGALEQIREIMALFKTSGPEEVSMSRYAHMLMQDLLTAMKERGLSLAMEIGEDQWPQGDDPIACVPSNTR